MLAGIEPTTGETVDEWSPASELDGKSVVDVRIPDDVNGGINTVTLEIHFLFFKADTLGAHGLGPWSESFVSHHCCRDCWFHSKCPCAYLPLRSAELANVVHLSNCRRQALRTAEETEGTLESLRCRVFTSKKAKAEALRVAGMTKLYFPLMGFKSARLMQDLTADVMHIFLCGITRHEMFTMLEDLIHVGKCFTWDELNEQRKIINKSLTPRSKGR